MRMYQGIPIEKRKYRMNHGVKEYVLPDERGWDIETEYVVYNHGVRESVPFWYEEQEEKKRKIKLIIGLILCGIGLFFIMSEIGGTL